MTDRELLEMAAKAAGLPIEWDGDGYVTAIKFRGHLTNYEAWNPLTDDGDALRLAVVLHLSLIDYKNSDHTERRTSVKVSEGHSAFLFVQELHGKDAHAATRRAIVGAAAYIGKGMP
jgi:hypothetical protein